MDANELRSLTHNRLADADNAYDIIGPARVLLARAEAAEALAAERLEDALFAEQRATDAEIERDEAVGRAEAAEASAAELERINVESYGLTIREIARFLGVTYEEAALVLRAAAHLIDQRAQLEAQP